MLRHSFCTINESGRMVGSRGVSRMVVRSRVVSSRVVSSRVVRSRVVSSRVVRISGAVVSRK